MMEFNEKTNSVELEDDLTIRGKGSLNLWIYTLGPTIPYVPTNWLPNFKQMN